jgi:uncharacterized damage-inducible protein DinB
MVRYRNSQGSEYANPLGDLLLHVANHGIHHRAQALNFLKRCGRTVPGGLDYIFYKLARPTVQQEAATVERLRAYGLEIETGPGAIVPLERSRIGGYFAYSDWAAGKVCRAAESLDSAALDRAFDIGRGSIRASLLHMFDAERWWLKNWTEGTSPFPQSSPATTLSELTQQWSTLAAQRNEFIARLDEEQAQRVVTVQPGGPPTKFRIVESLLQLCGHGTHHRAQVLNMLRHTGVTAPRLDIIVWIREHADDDIA